eukprot:4324661-Pyramimonas_sp.AAC.1
MGGELIISPTVGSSDLGRHDGVTLRASAGPDTAAFDEAVDAAGDNVPKKLPADTLAFMFE